MALLLYLTENREIRIDVDPEIWTKAFEKALRSDEVVQVRSPGGKVLAVNPQQVLYWKTGDQDQAIAHPVSTPLAQPR